jgi:hypothetical protein
MRDQYLSHIYLAKIAVKQKPFHPTRYRVSAFSRNGPQLSPTTSEGWKTTLRGSRALLRSILSINSRKASWALYAATRLSI